MSKIDKNNDFYRLQKRSLGTIWEIWQGTSVPDVNDLLADNSNVVIADAKLSAMTRGCTIAVTRWIECSSSCTIFRLGVLCASDSGFWLGLIGAIQIGLVLYCICIVQPVAGLIMYTRLARLDDGLHESSMLNSYNRSHNRLVQPQNVCIHDATGCTTGYIVWMGCYTTDWECKLHGPLISYIMYSVTVFKIKVADDASVLRSDWKRDKNSSRI